jgi:hypothetical protein
MRSCLLQLLDFVDTSESNLNHLKRMKGMRLRIGRYLGIADDGSFIIPWDIDLKRARQEEESPGEEV